MGNIVCTNNSMTINYNDGNVVMDMRKSICRVSTTQNNTAVKIVFQNNCYVEALATQFASPSGSAKSIQAAIAGFLNS